MKGRRRAIVSAVLATIGLAFLVAPASPAQADSLARGLLSAVRATSFDEVVDFGSVDDAAMRGLRRSRRCPASAWASVTRRRSPSSASASTICCVAGG